MSVPNRVRVSLLAWSAIAAVLFGMASPSGLPAQARPPSESTIRVPQYEVDAAWPKQPGNWMIGAIGGLAIDPETDHVWVSNRPRSLERDELFAAQVPPVGDCCVPAPAVLEFNAAGTLLRGWGGPADGYDWPVREPGSSLTVKGMSG